MVYLNFNSGFEALKVNSFLVCKQINSSTSHTNIPEQVLSFFAANAVMLQFLLFLVNLNAVNNKTKPRW
jgi:hypothetical protein